MYVCDIYIYIYKEKQFFSLLFHPHLPPLVTAHILETSTTPLATPTEIPASPC